MQLIRRDLRPMLFKLRHVHMIVTVKDTESQVGKSWVSGSIVKVTSECDVKSRTVRHFVAL
jgi:hypothetical protein